MTVYVVQDWKMFLEAVAGCRYRLYQIKKHKDVAIVRARAGSIGFEKVFNLSKPEERAEFEKICEDIEMHGFTEVIKTVNDDEFFV